MHGGKPILSSTGNLLAHAVSTGLRPHRMDMTSAINYIEELTDSVNILNKKIEVQAGMIEKMAKAINGLRSDLNTGVADIKINVGIDKGDKEAIQASLKKAKANKTKLVSIRDRLRRYQTKEMGTTLLTRRVYLSAAETWEQMYMAIEDELNIGEEEAREYAWSWRAFPVQKQEATSTIRVATPLMRTKSHMLQRIKEADIPVYFEAIALPVTPTKKNTGKRKPAAQEAEEPAPKIYKPVADACLDK